MSTPRDEVLEAARAGDAGALETLLREHQGRIYRFGLKMCGHPEDARDVAQDTLFAAARTIRGFRAESSVSTWLYTIARRFCIKKRRRPAAAPEVVSLDSEGSAAREAAGAAPDPERTLADRELGAALDAAIGALDPPQREVLLRAPARPRGDGGGARTERLSRRDRAALAPPRGRRRTRDLRGDGTALPASVKDDVRAALRAALAEQSAARH